MEAEAFCSTQETAWEANSTSEDKDVWGRAVPTHPGATTTHLRQPTISFGRKSTCDVQVKHVAVSGEHCRLIRDSVEDLVFLEDLSSNGTFINGRKIGKGNREVISDGTQFELIHTKKEKIAFQIFFTGKSSKQIHQEGPEATYDIREMLGTGSFALVSLGVHRKSGAKYAIKMIDKTKFALQHSTKRPEALMDEVKILQSLEHPNIIKIFDVYDTEKMLYLVLELVQGGDLFEHLTTFKGGGLPEETARSYFVQMLNAVAYSHSKNIIHRDLKPENVLLSTAKDVIKVTDFGLSRTLGEGSIATTLCGTPQYLAPEVMDSDLALKGYDRAVDLWSLGVILYVMLSGRAPFAQDQATMIRQIKAASFAFPDKHWAHVSDSAKDLITHLMKANPAQRYNIQQAFKHPWIRNTGNSEVEMSAATLKLRDGDKKEELAPKTAANQHLAAADAGNLSAPTMHSHNHTPNAPKAIRGSDPAPSSPSSPRVSACPPPNSPCPAAGPLVVSNGVKRKADSDTADDRQNGQKKLTKQN